LRYFEAGILKVSKEEEGLSLLVLLRVTSFNTKTNEIRKLK